MDAADADDEVVAANGKQREGKCCRCQLAVFIFHGMPLIIPIIMAHNRHTDIETRRTVCVGVKGEGWW